MDIVLYSKELNPMKNQATVKIRKTTKARFIEKQALYIGETKQPISFSAYMDLVSKSEYSIIKEP